MDESVVRHLEQKNEVADVLRRARALVDTPEKWIQGTFRTEDNRYCIDGAIIAVCCNSDRSDDCQSVCDFMGRVVGAHNRSAMFWNDAPERTHADILAAFDKAIALAERGL